MDELRDASASNAKFSIEIVSGHGLVIGDSNVVHQIFQGVSYPRLRYAESVAELLAFYTEAFVGRAQEIERILGFARQVDGGTLLVQAPAGYGKSALLAQVITQGKRDVPGAPRLLFFFIRLEAEQNTPIAFLQAINSQLLDLLNEEGGVPPDLNSLRSQFSQLWQQASRAATDMQPLLLLVDGLDAMALGGTAIAEELPAKPGPYVHVVISSRPGDGAARKLAEDKSGSEVPIVELEAFEEAEVRDLLCRYGIGAEPATALAPRVWTMSEGNPLLARFMCQAVARGGEAVLASLESSPPKGVEEYFQQEFDQLGDTGAGQATWDILGLLVLSPAGLAPDDLAELLGLGRRSEVSRALAPVRRFLVGESMLELSQRQLRELVLADLYPYKQAEYRERLLRWSQDYQSRGWPPTTPPFVLISYASLLKAAGQVEALYALVLDKGFRQAQLDLLGDAFATLNDLRLALELALTRDDLLTVLRCVAAYRKALQSDRLAQAVFEAVDGKDHDRALRRAGQCRGLPLWMRVMLYYLAWEAAEAGNAAAAGRAIAAGEAMPSSSIPMAGDLCDALLVRACRAMASRDGSKKDAVAWLAQWRSADEAKRLFEAFQLAQPSDSAESARLRAQLAEARKGKNREKRWSPVYESSIRTSTALLSQLADDPQTLEELSSAIKEELSSLYLRYRDVDVLPFAVACVAAPDEAWVREQLRRILHTALDQEGMTFAFDLASVLRAEADARGLPASDLASYLDRALASADKWGTAERALSARAAALFWHGRSDEAFAELAKPPRPSMSHAGYETITVLSLANRCVEFGQLEKARDSSWLGGVNLVEEATIQAMSVFDPQFRLERIALVNTYQQWLDQAAPNVDVALETLARITDYDIRLAYIDHLSARWSSPSERSLDGVKALIPLALTDATTLDALLARLVGPHLSQWSDIQVAEAMLACASGLTSAKPWMQWHA